MKAMLYVILLLLILYSRGQAQNTSNSMPHFECVDRCYFYELYISCYPPNCPPVHADPTDTGSRPLDSLGRQWYRANQNDPPPGSCLCDLANVSDAFILSEWFIGADPKWNYWPYHLCLSAEDFYSFENWQSLRAPFCEGLLSWNETRTCFENAANKWNSICSGFPQTDSLGIRCEFESFSSPCTSDSRRIQFSSSKSDFTSDPFDESWINIAARVSWTVWQGYDYIPPNNGNFVVQRELEYSTFMVNISEQWYNPPNGKRRAWTSHCPISSSDCNNRDQMSLCQILLHEMGHIFGLRHHLPKSLVPPTGCPYWFEDEDDGIYGDDDIMGRNIDAGICNLDLSMNDLCYFCKLHCPDACSSVTSVASDDIFIAKSISITVHPNPTNGIIIIDIASSTQLELQCTLLDSFGRVVQDFGIIAVLNGRAIQSIDLRTVGIARGTYNLFYHTGGEIAAIKRIVLQ